MSLSFGQAELHPIGRPFGWSASFDSHNLPLTHSAMSTMAEFLPGEAVWFLDHGNGENSSSKVVLNVGTEDLSLIETHVQEVARYFDIDGAKYYKGRVGDNLLVFYLGEEEEISVNDAMTIIDLIGTCVEFTPLHSTSLESGYVWVGQGDRADALWDLLF